jgi:hypothetical protein
MEPIVTGAPVMASWARGSRYISNKEAAEAGRTTDWVMTLRMRILRYVSNLNKSSMAVNSDQDAALA